ncbi:MAG: GNAT family N-acetyltransferase [Peptostreptococcaceae bacterium]
MNKVTYRDLAKTDYNRIKQLISEAFGFGEFIKDTKFLDSILNIYLQGCLLDSSFSKVAEKDNQVIGIILGNAKEDKKHLRKFSNMLSWASSGTKLAFSSKENKKAVKEFSKVTKTYNELICGKQNDFQGCIQLFIVSKESRGLGVGKTLIKYLSDYMVSMDVSSIYLYTDTRCNYGFYDSQNFKRLSEKEIYFESVPEKLNVFLYGYKF